MTDEQIFTLVITLLIISVVLSVAIGLPVFFSIRNRKHREFVLENSKAIHDIDELNTKYVFKKYSSPTILHHLFDNKGHWYKTETSAYLSREIRNNLEYWFGIKNKIEYNNFQLPLYIADVNKANVHMSKELCETNKKNYKKCLTIEQDIFKSKIQKPNTSIIIKVELQYISPKGQVNLMKSDNYNYTSLTRILDSVSTKRVDKKTYDKLVIAERAILSDSMRYDIMRRDGFRCVLCGLSAKDGAILHVDHIIPVSKGGKTEMSNLRTLCEKCNIGKSNKIE